MLAESRLTGDFGYVAVRKMATTVAVHCFLSLVKEIESRIALDKAGAI
ncbi:MAG: hypothetical protein KGI37_08050 [Alphaproteobacteria bacterium]|nr:hypothetical protein [Alphaproteobacteria bacterium]